MLIFCITVWQNITCAGNDNIHDLTSDRKQRLRVELGDFDDNSASAEFDNFAVGSEEEKYKLKSLGIYNGKAGMYGVLCNRAWDCEIRAWLPIKNA